MALAVALMAACGDGGETPGGVLVEASNFRWQSALDRPPSSGFTSIVRERLLAPLVRVGRDGLVEPELAASLAPSADGRAATVTLRDDARFASGRPITSADVIASLRDHLEEEGMSATALDARRVRLDFTAPRGDAGLLLSRIFIERADQAEAPGPLPYEEVDASGGWMVARVREPDVVLVPNPYARGSSRSLALVVRALGSPRAVVAAALAGEVDIVNFSNSVRDHELVRDFSPLRVATGALEYVGVLRFNCRSPKLTDPRVRRALNLGIDRADILARFVSADARPVGGLGDAPAVHDVAAAKALLEAAGWRLGDGGVRERDGVRLELTILMPSFFSQMVDLVQAVAADLRELGVDARVETGGASEVQARRVAGDFELTWTNYFNLAAPAAGQTFRPFRPSGPASGPYAGGHDFGRCAAPLQPWMAVFDGATGDAARQVAVAGLRGLVVADPPALFVFAMPSYWARHERFTVDADGQVVLRPGEALPRDRLESWLGEP